MPHLLQKTVNAPSIHQIDHKYHGMRIWVQKEDWENDRPVVTGYTTEKDVCMIDLIKLTLSDEWLWNRRIFFSGSNQ